MTKYFRNVNGQWSNNANWSTTSGGANDTVAPTAADDARLDSSSGNVTVGTGTLVCRSLDCTGYVGTVTHSAGSVLTIGDGTAGAGNVALKLVAGMTYTLGNSATSALVFASTSSTVQTINTGGKNLGNVTLSGAGCSYQLSAAMTLGAAATMTLTRGTLDTNGQTCIWGFFSGSNTNTRTLTITNSSITLNGAGTAILWDVLTTTGLTLNASGSTIVISPPDSLSKTFNGGGKTYGTLTYTGSSAAGLILTGSNTFSILTITTTTARLFQCEDGSTQTVTTLTLQGASGQNLTTDTSTEITSATLTILGTFTTSFVTRSLIVANSPWVKYAYKNAGITSGAVAITGSPITSKVARVVVASAGSVTVTGFAVTLTYHPSGGAVYTLVATAGAKAVAGFSITGILGRKMVASSGSTVVAGSPITGKVGLVLAALAGSVGVTGAPITGKRALKMVVSAGAVGITGAATTLKRALKFLASPGGMTVTGYQILGRRGVSLIASAGAVLVSGFASVFQRVTNYYRPRTQITVAFVSKEPVVTFDSNDPDVVFTQIGA